jgi:hypothetical protein
MGGDRRKGARAMTPSPAQRSAPWFAVLAALLLALHAWLGLSAAATKCATADEPGYLLAGQAYWKYQDYRLQPENGILPQRLAGLPAALRDERMPAPSDPRWSRSRLWPMAQDYLRDAGGHVGRLLAEARLMSMLWSLGTGLLVLLWARRLHGDLGGLLALAFLCLDPGFLAHGALATSDVCMSFLMLASLWAFRRLLDDYRPATLAASSLLLGLAFTAKFSAVLLPAAFALALLLGLASADTRPAMLAFLRPRRLLPALAAHLLGVWLVIWSLYGYRHGAAGPGMPELLQYYHSWDDKLRYTGLAGRLLSWSSRHHLLPDPYAFGFTFVLDMSQQRSAFLCGEWSMTGWPLFFPIAFLLKSPLAFLAACTSALALALGVRLRPTASSTRPRWTSDHAVLCAFGLVYTVVSVTSHLNIGHRHLLPLYPLLFIGLGCLAAEALRRHSRRLAVLSALLLAGQAAASLSARPDYLAYFNELAGGRDQGYRYLVDSSLDWGQDLPELSTWLPAHAAPGEPVYLSYFGLSDPAQYGIHALPLPSVPQQQARLPLEELRPGLYCISASNLQQVFLLPSAWTKELENEYQRLLLSPRDGTGDRQAARLELLRFARLCSRLRLRSPEAVIGGSILVYRLDARSLSEALYGSAL